MASSLQKLSTAKLWKTVCQSNVKTIDDVDILVKMFGMLPKTLLKGFIKEEANLESWIQQLIDATQNNWTVDECYPWFQVYLVLSFFGPVLSDAVIPIRQEFLHGLYRFIERNPEWAKVKRIKIYWTNLEFTTLFHKFWLNCEMFRHVTHLSTVIPSNVSTAKIELKHLALIIFNMKSLQIATYEDFDHWMFYNNFQLDLKESRLVHIKCDSLGAIEMMQFTQMDPGCAFEEIHFSSNGYDESIYNFIIHSEPPLINYFLKKGEFTFPKFKEEFIINDMKSLHMKNWHLLTWLIIQISCLDFAEIVHTIGTQMPNLTIISVNSCKEEKILGDPQDIVGIKALGNIGIVQFVFGKVSPTILKAALALANTAILNFFVKCYTEMNSSVMKDCFQSRRVRHIVGDLPEDHNSLFIRTLWNHWKNRNLGNSP